MVLKIGFIKLGNIGSAPLLEMILDERADREDLDVRVIGTGAKLGVEQSDEAARKMIEFKPSLVIICSANAALPGPMKAREIISSTGIPCLIVSDAPAKKAVAAMAEKGFGFIIVEGDAMIGARREFLDPTEMAIFNAEIIKTLAITGVLNLLVKEMDKLINALKRGEKPTLPQVTVDKETAILAACFNNPYAAAKAMAAYEMLRKVADLDSEGCFKIQEKDRYLPIVAAAHEILRSAARLADDAREIEKDSDNLTRIPHYKDGKVLCKKKLLEKPE